MSKLRSFGVLFLLAGSAFAQEAVGTAILTGTVSDPTGAALVGAKVTARDTATQFVAAGQSDSAGLYYISYLVPGPYEVTVQAKGFQTYIRTGILLQAGDAPRIDIALQVGATTQSVTVNGAAPLLQTEDAVATASMPNAAFESIPVMQARTWNVLTYLPGVVQTTWNAFYANGQANRQIGNSLDGISAAQPVIGVSTSTQALEPAMDSVEEVRMVSSGIPAEYGHGAAGMMVAVTKTGTNQLHGSAEDRYLNNDLLARRYFDAVPPTPTSYHEMQASLLGPVVLPKLYNGRNKTFFLIGFERHQERASETEIDNVPNQDMYNGNFSFGGLGLPIYDPSTTRQNSTGTWIRDPFPNNQIPVSRFDPVTEKFLSYSPWRPANQPGYFSATGPQQDLAVPTKVRYYLSRYDFKVDQQLSAAHRFFVRYDWNRNRQLTDRGYGDLEWDALDSGFVPYANDIQGGAFSDTYSVSTSAVNEFRFGYNRYKQTTTPTTDDQGWAQKLGMPNVSAATFPIFAGLGGTGLGANTNGYNDNNGGYTSQTGENFTVSESISMLKGHHAFKVGYEVLRSRFDNLAADNPSGIYNMGGTELPFTPATGNGFASFLLGTVSSATFTQNLAAWLPRWWTHSLYAQDTYKIGSNLTFNYGLRWTYESPYDTKYGQQSEFNPNLVDPVSGLMGAITHPKGALASPYHKNFQPRLGLAYNFRSKWVFRSSFGIETEDLLSPQTNMAFDEYVAKENIQAAPGDPRTVFTLSQGPGAIQYPLNSDGSARYSSTNYSARTATWYDPHMRNPYIMTWNGGVQYQLAPTWLAEMSYAGSAGVGLFQAWNINAIPLNVSTNPAVLEQIYQATQNYLPHPQFGQITGYSNFGHSTYHAGTIRLEKRLSHGVTLSSMYTHSKAIDTSDTDGTLVNGISYYDRSLEKAVASYDRPHRWVTNFTGDVPFGVGHRFMNSHGWKDRLLGGWQFTWSQTAQSGSPFTVTFADSPYQYLPGADRPNILLPFGQAQVPNYHIGPNRFPASAQNPYLNAAAFAYPAPFTAGDLGRNTFRSRYLYWAQASLSKHWTYRERFRFFLRWDVNNVTKYPEFSTPGSVYDLTNLGSFGRFTGEIGNFGEVGSRMHSIIVFRIDF